MYNWSCANKRNKSVNTIILSRIVVHKRNNKWKNTIVCLFVLGVTQENDDVVWVQGLLVAFGKNQSRVSLRFLFLIPVLERLSSDLLWAITNYWTVAYLESCQTFLVELFCENNQRLYDIKYLCKKAPLQMFDWVLNTPLTEKVL